MWRAATFIGSISVTVGWVVTSETTIRNSKRQHTISRITAQTSDQSRIANRRTIKAALPSSDSKLTVDIVGFLDNELHELPDAIDRELNFFEFAAAGIQSDDIDENLPRECLQGQFVNFYRQNQDYINHWRAKLQTTWRHIATMYQRWK